MHNFGVWLIHWVTSLVTNYGYAYKWWWGISLAQKPGTLPYRHRLAFTCHVLNRVAR